MSTTNNTTADTTAKDAGEGGVVEAVAWIDPRDLNCLSFEDGNLWPGVFRHWTGRHSEPLYSQAAIDTLRAQLEAAEAEVARLRGINSDLCRNHNARLVDAAKSEARTKALEAEAERLRGLLQQTAAVGITMLFDSHADDVRGEFSVGELMEVVAVSEPLNAQDAKVEKVYRTAWDAARTKEATP